MDFSIRLMKQEERAFAYTQDQQTLHSSGCIGHLRVDMDSSGTGFFSSWDTHSPSLKDEAFKSEFDELINELRFNEELGGILTNRSSMSKFCHAIPGSEITDDGKNFGFRIDTDEHAYMLRLNPNKGEYNAYIYAYDREMLDSFLEPQQEVEQEGPITVLVVEPGKVPYVKEIDPGLKSLQSEVDGWSEAVYPFVDPVAIVCNEEGKLNGLPLNRALIDDESGEIYDIIAGTFLVTGLTEDNFGSLNDEQIKKFSERFHHPEAFLQMGNQIIRIIQDVPKPKESVMDKLKNQPSAPKKDAPAKKHKEEIR